MRPLVHATIPIVEYNRVFLKMVAEKYGGNTTLNEIRVMNCIIGEFLHGRSRCVGVSRVSEELDMPKSTVSRVVGTLLEEGWIAEAAHPDDRRRRVLSPSEKTQRGIYEEAEVVQRAFARMTEAVAKKSA